MGSASREALAAAKGSLGGLLGRSVGQELLNAAAQIADSAQLLSIFHDPAIFRADKEQLLNRVFGGLSDGCKAVLIAAISQTWSTPAELVSGIEELGISAQAIAEPQLSDDLLAVAATLDSSHDLELELGNKLADPEAKIHLIKQLLSEKISAGALGVITHLLAHPRPQRLAQALRDAARVAAQQGGFALATVTVAAPLSPAQSAQLAQLLQQRAGQPVKISTVIDPAVVGGVKIQVGDSIIDGSVKTRLDDLRQQLVA